MCKFKVIMEPCDEGGFVVSCPALPGCHSQGETEKEALANIKEAILGCLEVLNDKAMATREEGKVLEVAL
ncbi:MAG: type II toxin-antitoxin system HicB family antitoxin [bacterium]